MDKVCKEELNKLNNLVNKFKEDIKNPKSSSFIPNESCQEVIEKLLTEELKKLELDSKSDLDETNVSGTHIE